MDKLVEPQNRLRDLSADDLALQDKTQPDVLYEYGWRLYQNDYFQESLDLLEAADRAGYPPAALTAGLCLEYGFGRVEEAVEYYKKAARAENPRAYAELARCYLNGTGVSEDPKKAFEQAFLGAGFGSVQAHRLLGLIYRDGLATDEKEFLLAEQAYRYAATKGDAISCAALADMHLAGEAHISSADEAFFYKTLEIALCSPFPSDRKNADEQKETFTQALLSLQPLGCAKVLRQVGNFLSLNKDNFFFLDEMKKHQRSDIVATFDSLASYYLKTADQIEAGLTLKQQQNDNGSDLPLGESIAGTPLRPYKVASRIFCYSDGLTPCRLKAALGMTTPVARSAVAGPCSLDGNLNLLLARRPAGSRLN